ncbi:hypothetical protein [Pseudocnuella soli]|uniref:hypothetical protein n=1 Tax=Pseudocnuella soli TaxID=2502779 RepID=UPI0010521095|nr:hypothetical protein [Pseudocnuella soli]
MKDLDSSVGNNKPHTKYNATQKFTFFGLALLWLSVNAICLYRFGIVTDYESIKYIANADLLVKEGHFMSPQFYLYSVQILLIAFSKTTGTFPILPVVIQLWVNAYATFCFYRVIVLLNGRKKIAAITTAVFISMVYYQLYNTHLFTESLYFSFSIIFFSKLLKINRLYSIEIYGVILLLILLYFTRPVGVFFIAATFIFITLKFFRKRAIQIFTFVGIFFLLLFTILINLSLNIGGTFDFLLPFSEAHIICGVPTISPPHQLSVPIEKNSIQGILYVVTHYWDLYFPLMIKRFFAFWGVTRPYFEKWHNLILSFYFYTTYIVIAFGIKNWRHHDAPVIAFALCMASLTMFSALLACDDWHNRFILSIFPILLILSTYAFKEKRVTSYSCYNTKA